MNDDLATLIEMRNRLDRYRAGLMKRIKAARAAKRAASKPPPAGPSATRGAQLAQWEAARALKREIAQAYLAGERRAEVQAKLGLSTRTIERLLDEGIKWLERDVLDKIARRDGTPKGRYTRAMQKAKKPQRTAELDRVWRARKPNPWDAALDTPAQNPPTTTAQHGKE